MTKREWKRRYLHERKLRKHSKWLRHHINAELQRCGLAPRIYGFTSVEAW